MVGQYFYSFYLVLSERLNNYNKFNLFSNLNKIDLTC